jgi:hypothetical protein
MIPDSQARPGKQETFMKRTTIALLLLLIPAPLWGQKAGPKAENPLRAFVRTHARRQAYGLYFRGNKVGWEVAESKLGKYAGKEVALDLSEAYLALGGERGKGGIRIRAKTVYSLEGDGEVLFSEQQTTEGDREEVLTAVREGKNLTITARRGKTTSKRTVPAPRKTLRNALHLTRWLKGRPKKGDTFVTWSLELDEKDVDVKEVYSFQEKRSLLWGGVSTEVFAVTTRSEGVRMEALVLPDGTPLKGLIGGALEMRAEKEPQARKLDGKGIDFLSASSIEVDRKLGNPARVTALRLEVAGLGDHTLPTSHRQRILREGGKVILSLKRDHRTASSSPLGEEERKKMLEATPTLEVGDKKIQALALEIVGDEKDPLEAARRLGTWVYRNLRKTYSANASTALEVLENRAGDCTEHTLLFVALARAAGIPAREVLGVAYGENEHPLFGWHAWAEVHDGKQWVSIDPTWHEVYVDATHITFSQNDRDWSWVNVLGTLKFKVVKVERD